MARIRRFPSTLLRFTIKARKPDRHQRFQSHSGIRQTQRLNSRRLGLGTNASLEGGPQSELHVKERTSMTVKIETSGPVWTVIHNRPEARNAMDPESADALTRAFLEFDAD